MPDTIPTALVTAAFGGMATALAAVSAMAMMFWRRLNERDDQTRDDRASSETRIADAMDVFSTKVEAMTAALIRVTVLLEARRDP